MSGGATTAELETMRHMLGFGHHCVHPGWRNYGCYPTDDPKLLEMERKGLVRRGRVINDGRDAYFAVTEAWCKALGVEVAS